MSIGAANLLRDYKNDRMAIAEALLKNKLKNYELTYVAEVVNLIILEAAKFRLLYPDVVAVPEHA